MLRKTTFLVLLLKEVWLCSETKILTKVGPRLLLSLPNTLGHCKHATSGSPEGFPELHVCFRGASQDEIDSVFLTERIPSHGILIAHIR